MNELPFSKRIKKVKQGDEKGNYVLYWMQGAFRLSYNHSFSFSKFLANYYKKPLLVLIIVNPNFPNANSRNMKFFLEGVLEVVQELKRLKVPYHVKVGNFKDVVKEYSKNAIALVTDFAYLPGIKKIRKEVYDEIDKTIYEVDTNVLIPVEIASNKQEYAARTIRPKILEKVPSFIDDFQDFDYKGVLLESFEDERLNNFELLKLYPYVSYCNVKGGYSNALITLENFLREKFSLYAEFRNDVKKNVESGLSFYLHFGHISVMEILHRMKDLKKDKNYEVFFEQLIVRRELAHNFTYYAEKLDDLYSLIPYWAKKTLQEHSEDPRKYVYSLEDFENARTHDYLWNYAQRQLLETGKIHNYLRMYWGKKVIEWSKSPEEAYRILVYLNDKYALDGRDPNGYVGILWCFGLHDRPFFERPIFGRVRYMSGRKIKV